MSKKKSWDRLRSGEPAPSPTIVEKASGQSWFDGSPAAAVLALITFAGLLLRLADLSRPMDYDESFTWLYYASRPLRDALADYALPNNHLLHTILVHYSTRFLGNHPGP